MEINQNNLSELQKKILKGMELVSERLIENARQTGQELVVMKDNKIVRVKYEKK